MKKKSLTLLVAIALIASLTACGGKTEEATGSNVNEPDVETTVSEESQVAESTEAPVESQETTESTEAPSEEAPVEAAPYEVSELVFPDGSIPADMTMDDFVHFIDLGGYDNPDVIVPYYTVTNTSDSTYSIDIEDYVAGYEDAYFEPGESIVLPGRLFRDLNDVPRWCNILDAIEVQHCDLQTRDEVYPEQNVIQEMVTITFDESKLDKTIASNVMRIDIDVPENTVPAGSSYVIYYDADGNVISSGTTGGYSVSDKIFRYALNWETKEPIVWATADVYYGYKAAAQ